MVAQQMAETMWLIVEPGCSQQMPSHNLIACDHGFAKLLLEEADDLERTDRRAADKICIGFWA